MPNVPDRTVVQVFGLDPPSKADLIFEFRPRKFPRIAKRQPVFRIFELTPVLDSLPKQAMIVADAIAICGDREGRHALHETGGEPAEAAIAKRRIRFKLTQFLEIDAKFGKRSASLLDHLHIGERIDQQTADQKFEAQVIDSLAMGPLGFIVRGDPALDDPIAHGECRRNEPVARARSDDALAKRIGELFDDRVANCRDVRCHLHAAFLGRSILFGGSGFDFQFHRGGPPSGTQGPPARNRARPGCGGP